MSKLYAVSFLLLGCFFDVCAFMLPDRPIVKVYTPNSILQHKEKYKPLAVGKRMRYATCTGAVWFHDNYLAVLNLYGQKISSYYFDEDGKSFSLMQEVDNAQGAGLKCPEQLAVSPDGKLLAVSNTVGSFINIYAVDTQTHRITPKPIYTMPTRGLIHNLRFTPDGNYLAIASFDARNAICVYKVIEDAHSMALMRVYREKNNEQWLRLKGINFTKDGRYAVLGYALSINTTKKRPLESLLVVRRYHQNGRLGDIVSSVAGDAVIEDVALLFDDTAVVATNQANDTLRVHQFDAQTGQLAPDYLLISNPEAQLSFPHGMAASADGKYLVATNYGDDSFNLYQVH